MLDSELLSTGRPPGIEPGPAIDPTAALPLHYEHMSRLRRPVVSMPSGHRKVTYTQVFVVNFCSPRTQRGMIPHFPVRIGRSPMPETPGLNYRYNCLRQLVAGMVPLDPGEPDFRLRSTAWFPFPQQILAVDARDCAPYPWQGLNLRQIECLPATRLLYQLSYMGTTMEVACRMPVYEKEPAPSAPTRTRT